ncbi:MAG TPA: hypothetical protein VK660_01330, partial [Xanthomonadaceae bacterium]|nr:hypothetical protein [Xanthomonadaceae bacterium]
RAALELSAQVCVALDRHYVASGEMQSVSKQVEALTKHVAGDTAKSAVANSAIAKSLTDFNAKLAPLSSGEGEDSLKLGAIGGALIALQADLEGTDREPSQPQREVYARYSARLDRALAAWSAVKTSDLPALNASLHAGGLDAIKVPARAELPVIDPGESRDIP